MEPEFWLHNFRCRVCGNRFGVKRKTPDSSKVKTPRCPRKSCGGKARASHVPDIGLDVAAGKAPGHIGHDQVRAYDMALEMTAQDHQMGDLKDRPRPGETSAPPLRPDLQKQADNFWSGGGTRRQPQGGRRGKVDLSPIYGGRATAAQAQTPSAPQFTADRGAAIAPILQMPGKRPGDSPVPHTRIIAG